MILENFGFCLLFQFSGVGLSRLARTEDHEVSGILVMMMYGIFLGVIMMYYYPNS